MEVPDDRTEFDLGDFVLPLAPPPFHEADPMSRVCVYCQMPGHNAQSCHVKARGAYRPDEADRIAQRVVASLTKMSSFGEMRRDVAAAIREVMQR